MYQHVSSPLAEDRLTEVALSSSTSLASLICTNMETKMGKLRLETVIAQHGFSPSWTPCGTSPPFISHIWSVYLTPRWFMATHTWVPHTCSYQLLAFFRAPGLGHNPLSMMLCFGEEQKQLEYAVIPLLRSEGEVWGRREAP